MTKRSKMTKEKKKGCVCRAKVRKAAHKTECCEAQLSASRKNNTQLTENRGGRVASVRTEDGGHRR